MKINFKKIFSYIILALILIENVPFNIVSAETVPAGNLIDAIDSFRITNVYDPNLIYIEWKNGNPGIEGTGELVSGAQVRLYLDWSVKENNTVNPGDYFTFTFPDIFVHSWIETKENINILHPDDGTVMAKYSIRDNNGKKELIITFTEGVIGHESINGKYELAVFTGTFETTTETSMTFEINGNTTTINNGITGNPAPPPDYVERGDAKWGGRASLEQVIDGHYYFKWTIWVNFNFDTTNNFFLNDMIRENSPHVLITPQTVSDLNINVPDNLYQMTIREYTGADNIASKDDRYNQFQQHINSIGGWYEDYMVQYVLDTSSMTFVPEPIDGIDSNGGISLNNFVILSDGKGFSANLGRVTRPIIIDYYTITTQPFSTNAFYDDATASAIQNTVVLNGTTTKSNHIYTIWIDESASIGGIYGNYSFTVKKSDENSRGLAGATFALYTSSDCEGIADRIAQSKSDGSITFGNLKTGTYYIKETNQPEGYALNETIYKIELTNSSCIISAPGGTHVTEIINYTDKPTEETSEDEETNEDENGEEEESNENETEEEEDDDDDKDKKDDDDDEPEDNLYIPPVELTTEPTTPKIIPDDDTTATEVETTTVSETEPTSDELEITEVIEEESEVIIFTDEEIITVPGLPEGYFIEQIGDDLYEIFDDDGIPLGGVTVPEGELIEELDYEDIIDNMIPLEDIDFPEESITNVPSQTGNNPQTNDLIWISVLIFISFSLISLLLISKKRV